MTIEKSIDRFKKLPGGVELLLEYKILQGLKWLNYNCEISHNFQTCYFSKNTVNQEYTMCFNQEYDLVALGQTTNLAKSFVSIFAYNSNLTKNFGALVYCFEAPHVSSGVNFSWSPNGQLLLCLVRAPDFETQDKLFFFRYFPKKRVMRQLLNLQLKCKAHYCKPYLWIGLETCIFPSVHRNNVTLITFKNSGDYFLRQKENFFPPPCNSAATRGCFSAHSLGPDQYCVCCLETCSKESHQEHHRILISLWASGEMKALKIIDVPGLVVDLTFLNTKMFALIRNHDCYSFFPDYLSFVIRKKTESDNPLSSSPPPCSLLDPWVHKSGGPKSYKIIWVKLLSENSDDLKTKALTRIDGLFSKIKAHSNFRTLDDSSITYTGAYSLLEKASRRQCLHPSVFNLIFINLTHIIPTHNFPSQVLAAFEHLYHDVGNNSAPVTLIHPNKPLVTSIWYSGKIEFNLALWASLADKNFYPKTSKTYAKFNNGIHSHLILSRKVKPLTKKIKLE